MQLSAEREGCCYRGGDGSLSERLVKMIEHVELETTPDFFEIFVEGCQFKPMQQIGQPSQLAKAGGDQHSLAKQ